MKQSYDPRSYWNAVAQQIEGRVGRQELAGDDSPVYRHKRERLIAKLRALPVRGASVLEVGCGPGGNLAVLADEHPARLAGCDISETMLELARGRVGGSADLHIVDGANLPFESRAFDVVLTVTVLQHNPDGDMRRLLREMCRVAARSIYIFEDVALRGTSRGSMFIREPAVYASECAEAGFDLVAAEPLGVHVSEVAGRLLRRLTLSRRVEGSPSSRRHILAESLALPVLVWLDHRIPQRQGLTMLEFARREGGEELG